MGINIHIRVHICTCVTSNHVQSTTSITDAVPLSTLILHQLQLLCLLMRFTACEE